MGTLPPNSGIPSSKYIVQGTANVKGRSDFGQVQHLCFVDDPDYAKMALDLIPDERPMFINFKIVER